MPRYNYVCKQCDETAVLPSSIEERNDEKACTACGGRMERDTAPAKTSFTLKGGGWAQQGYA